MGAMTAQEALDRSKNLDFEKVWAMFAETDRKFAESAEQLTRLEKTVERVSNNVGGLNGSIGELVETLIAPHLAEKFDAWNYNLKRIFHRVYIYDDTNSQRGEIDILLSNTTVCMAVEVKRWLEKTEQVDDHIKRMQLIRKYPPAEAKGKGLLGAIAGAVVTPQAREKKEKNGFFVLELTGDDVQLLQDIKDFQPALW
jgi:predicted AAA+ superfamily ATPase